MSTEEEKIIVEEQLFKKLRGLKQYKDLTDEEVKKAVKEKLAEKDLSEELDIEGMFIDKDEKKEAEKFLRKYLNTYSIETVAERNTLKQLVFLEVFNNRIQRELNNYYKEEQPVPPKTVESLHSNLNQINNLKTKLGLSADKKDKSLSEGYGIFDTMLKKWKIWREENQGSRTLCCPHCGKMVLLKIRTDAWEALKHPFFKDRILANPYLMELYKEGKITKHDVARVLGTSLDYIDWLVKKVYYREFNTPSPEELRDPELESGITENVIQPKE
jgi:DNA-directed RNA polymerase subunit RPC12/RpoP